MGIIFRQSLVNTVLTYLGFALGAVNILFLYTRFLSESEFGLVGVILSTGALLMPVMSFGIPNTLVKYFSAYKDTDQLPGFLTFMLVLPALAVLPLAALCQWANPEIGAFLARKTQWSGITSGPYSGWAWPWRTSRCFSPGAKFGCGRRSGHS